MLLKKVFILFNIGGLNMQQKPQILVLNIEIYI